MPLPATQRFKVSPALVQNKPYPLYNLFEGTDLLLQADKESCYIYAFGWLTSRLEDAEKKLGINV